MSACTVSVSPYLQVVDSLLPVESLSPASRRHPPRPAPSLPTPPPSHADPWNLLIYTGIGGYVGSHIPAVEQQLLDDVNQMRADRNMKPLSRVGGVFGLKEITNISNKELAKM